MLDISLIHHMFGELKVKIRIFNFTNYLQCFYFLVNNKIYLVSIILLGFIYNYIE